MSQASPRRLFGLGVWCDTDLPKLHELPSTAGIDVRAWLSSTPRWLAALSGAPEQLWYTSPLLDSKGEPFLTGWLLGQGGDRLLRYSDGTEYIINPRGTEIAARRREHISIDEVATYLFGPIFGFLLRIRGITCLHASVVAVDDWAIAIAGPEGAGKSTLAAALAARGMSTLADDIAPLVQAGGRVVVPPGFPRLRIWPDAALAMSRLRPGDHWREAHAGHLRYSLDLIGHGFRVERSPLPLGAVYLIEPGARGAGEAVRVENLTQRNAFMGLIANTFANRLLDRVGRLQEFETIGRLVDSMPVRRLAGSRSLDVLQDRADAITQDASRLMAARAGTHPIGVAPPAN